MIEKLLSAFEKQLTAQCTSLAYVAEDWGQMQQDTPPVKYPAALVSIEEAEYSNEGRHIQQAVLSVRVKLYHVAMSNISRIATDQQKATRERIWLLYESVNKAIHACAFLPVGFAPPMRDKMKHRRLSNGVDEISIDYSVALVDTTCEPVTRVTPARPIIHATTI